MPQFKSHRRILFVDDEPNIRATLPVILRHYGFAVRVAATVAEAMNEIKTHEFDLLLCDLNIERAGDGYIVVRAIRDANPRCATVILTAYPDVESAVEGIHLGVDDYIIKPANADTLVAILAEKLATREPKARIFSVSYDKPLAETRQMLLEREGYEVVSALEFEGAIERCQKGQFDLLILGHSIPHSEKLQIAENFRRTSPAPIICLQRDTEESEIQDADYHIDPAPEAILETVAKVVRTRSARSKGVS